jgi:Flp pilus assembly protein CpaB
MVSTTAGDNLTFKIAPGMRAVSIGVKEVVIAGGNITPGDRVDVIGVVEVPPNTDIAFMIFGLTGEPAPMGFTQFNRPSIVTFTLLHNAKVLAVAQNLPTQRRPLSRSN